MRVEVLELLVLVGSGVAAVSGEESVESFEGDVETPLQPGEKPPIAHTYRNAYGTHFECSSTCMLMLGMHVVLVIGGLLLLSVVPVRFTTNEKLEAPFVLWFGSPKKKLKQKDVEQQEEEEGQETESLWHRASSWLVQIVSSFSATAPGRDVDMRYRFHADLTQQLAASAMAAKTYESIAVATDDLEVKPPPSPRTYESIAVDTDDLKVETPPLPLPPSLSPLEADEAAAAVMEELETKLPPPPRTDISTAAATGDVDVESLSSRLQTRPSNRSSIFVAPLSPPSVSKMRQGSSRFASDAGSAKADPINRRTSREGSGAVATKEDFVRAASRRQSMAVRTERRVTLAEEDVSYENLGDDEIRMYEYLEFVRELLDGLTIKKVCQKSGRVVSRKLYITPDMTTVFWNPAGTFKRLRTKSSMQTLSINQVLKGVHGSANVTIRSSPERDALCVSIRYSDSKWLVLEAKTEVARQRLFLGFTRLDQEKLEQEAAAVVEPIKAAIPEESEVENVEALPGEQEHQGQLTETTASIEQPLQAGPTKDAEVTIEREEKFEALNEEEFEEAAEHFEHEEKAPPPQPDERLLLRHELLSITASYRDEPSDGEQQEDDNVQRGEQGEHDQIEEEVQILQTVESQAVQDDLIHHDSLLHEQDEEEHKSTGVEGMTQELPFQQPEEEEEEQKAEEGREYDELPREVSNNPDEGPEMSRE